MLSLATKVPETLVTYLFWEAFGGWVLPTRLFENVILERYGFRLDIGASHAISFATAAYNFFPSPGSNSIGDGKHYLQGSSGGQ